VRLGGLRALWNLASPYFISAEGPGAWTLLAIAVAGGIAFARLGVVLNGREGELISALAAANAPRFAAAVASFLGWLAALLAVLAFYQYALNALPVFWRRWFTLRLLDGYLRNRAYYRVAADTSIDNPDERIANDVHLATSVVVILTLFLTAGPATIIFSSEALWRRSHELMFVLLVYGLAVSLIAVFAIGGRLTALNIVLIRRIADLRFALARVRRYAEAIAFHRGEAREAAIAGERLERSYRMQNRIYWWSDGALAGYTAIVAALPPLAAMVWLAPDVLAARAEVGVVIEAAGNAAALVGGFTLLVGNLGALAAVFAGIERVRRLAAAVAAAPPAAQIAIEPAESLAATGLAVRTPDGARTLFHDLAFAVPRGGSLLVSGPSGSGKSSLLRAIAGLWTLGAGAILRPAIETMLFLPQRAYLIAGTLRDQVRYPSDHPADDIAVHAALAAANLADLAERAGGLDAVHDWSRLLSPGEQQRLAFARVFLQRPSIVVLDEATSSLDADNERRMYERLGGLGITVVSVGHNASLGPFHAAELRIA